MQPNSSKPVSPPTSVLGVDVGARRLHGVALDGRGRVLEAAVFPAADTAALVAWAAGAAAIAIDAPDGWSTAPHAADARLSPKFRTGRCAEIALGQQFGVWVPWVTPTAATEGWMAVGVELFAALRNAGDAPVEVYPHAAFRRLNRGGVLPAKQSHAGAATRVALLQAAGVVEATLPAWSHDALDAAVAAVVALHCAQGRAEAATCGHDRSAIWLPAPP